MSKEKDDDVVIAEQKTYTDARGRRVTENILVHGEAPENFVRFVGTVGITVGANGGAMNRAMTFPIPAGSVADAYELFADHAERLKDRVEDDMRRQSLMAGADPRMARLVLGPDGKVG